ncbi:MAG: hypothetical protein AB7G13_18865 [Lautropia sp.]
MGALLAALVMLLAAGCSRSPSEQGLRDVIAEMAAAVEKRDAAAFLSHVADDFTRESGGMDQQQLRALLLGLFLRNQRIDVVTSIREIRIDGKRATVRLSVLATGGAGLLPERGRAWDLTTAWRHDGDWKIFNAQWTE